RRSTVATFLFAFE
ncbi:hypothetical protein RDABS01_035375, partial [Bienertia sinuspersici]